jgi:CBS domain-containing protein
MTTVRQLLEKKGFEVLTIGPDDTVLEAIRKMSDKNVGALVVVDGGKPVGIITERHYARNVFLKGRASRDTRVGDVMSAEVLFAEPDQTVEECMAVMTDMRVRHLPVLDGKRMIGIISIGDLVKSIISDQKFVIEQLEHYIAR